MRKDVRKTINYSLGGKLHHSEEEMLGVRELQHIQTLRCGLTTWEEIQHRSDTERVFVFLFDEK